MSGRVGPPLPPEQGLPGHPGTSRGEAKTPDTWGQHQGQASHGKIGRVCRGGLGSPGQGLQSPPPSRVGNHCLKAVLEPEGQATTAADPL